MSGGMLGGRSPTGTPEANMGVESDNRRIPGAEEELELHV